MHVIDELGRFNRCVELEVARAHLVTWACYPHGDGDATIRSLLDQWKTRGRRTWANPSWTSEQLYVTDLHNLLPNPYLNMEIHYRRVIYPGLHEPLVDSDPWQQVQDLLSSNAVAGTHNALTTTTSAAVSTEDPVVRG